MELHLACPVPFHLRDVVFSHGWHQLPPYAWDESAQSLSRVERLPSGQVVRLDLSPAEGGVRVVTDAPPSAAPVLEARLRWLLALSDDLTGFHGLCEAEPALLPIAARGQGRILRCPTVWEDLVKTLFSVNTTWGQTKGMTRRLVEQYGEPHADGERAFPEPEAVAAVEPEALQRECRVGYRAGPLSSLARAVAGGELDLEALKNPALPVEEVEARLRALKGIGPYAAANVLLLLGRYDHLPVDSWFRKVVRAAWFPGREGVSDREMVAAFERYRPYRSLVYYFYDWEAAAKEAQ